MYGSTERPASYAGNCPARNAIRNELKAIRNFLILILGLCAQSGRDYARACARVCVSVCVEGPEYQATLSVKFSTHKIEDHDMDADDTRSRHEKLALPKDIQQLWP